MQTLFEDVRLTMQGAIAQTIENLRYHLPRYKKVAIAYSGGKDSSCVLTLILHLIETGQVPKPESLTVLYADTRQELPPLHASAMTLMEEARSRGCEAKVVLPPMDKRFWVYILGRGVPSPNNGTLRWCTRQIKVEPMTTSLESLRSTLEPDERMLILTGVRQGESAARDQRISLSCSKDGGECGQGWFQTLTAPQTDTLAPILHWRVCHVWDWLNFEALMHGFPTQDLAEAYGMSTMEGEEGLNARTGCICCPLVSSADTALTRVIRQPHWSYLKPLTEIERIHYEIRDFRNRLRKDGTERKKNGSLTKNPGRVGPLSLPARKRFLDEFLEIQLRVNQGAIALNRPLIDLVNSEEEARIRELIALKTFPDKWTGNELPGDAMIPEVYQDGSVQNLLFPSLE